jgi:hypothetical protein
LRWYSQTKWWCHQIWNFNADIIKVKKNLWISSVAMFYIPLMKGKVVFQLILLYVRYFWHVVSQRLLTFIKWNKKLLDHITRWMPDISIYPYCIEDQWLHLERRLRCKMSTIVEKRHARNISHIAKWVETPLCKFFLF